MKMKKLCGKGRGRGRGSVHPLGEEHLLSLLPVAILSLVAALSAEDREVLAYLISNSGDPNRLLNKSKSKRQLVYQYHHHPPLFNCDCFSCYTSYWVRWDSSPSRQLIHQIIDAFEDMTITAALEMKTKKSITNSNTITPAGKKDRRRKRSGKPSSSSSIPTTPVLTHLDSSSKHLLGACTESLDEPDGAAEHAEVKGSVDRLITFIALKFFGLWG